ncbi:hypothetical protein SBY92_002609 [Candida maltosa Xu316]
MLNGYTKFHEFEDHSLTVKPIILEQLEKLTKLLEFENISSNKLSTNAISLKNYENSDEFYKLLINYNQLTELIVTKNNELTLVKFKCHELINSITKQLNHEPTLVREGSSDTDTDEICKKLQDIFNPKEEFDSTL